MARKTVVDNLEAKDLFSSVPPLEAFRHLSLSPYVAWKECQEKIIETSHFHGRLDRELFTEKASELCDRFEGDMGDNVEEELAWVSSCKQHLARGLRQPLT